MAAYLVLARKYRPATFKDVVGQEHVVRTLSNSILSGRVAHAFLFCGVRGVGKTTVARVLAKALNCEGRKPSDANPCNECSSCREISSGISVDVQEIDGASNTSVENIREINDNIKYPPVSSKYKIIIIDEVHMISINAFNALLKTLEEPPEHAKFIFATTEIHKVPATINSRCQRFNFRTISLNDISTGMQEILDQEKITYDTDALDIIAREAQGSFRDALSLLDQVIAVGSNHVSVGDVSAALGIVGRELFGRLMSAIIDRDTAQSLEVIRNLYELGYDPEQFYLDLVQYLRNLNLIKSLPKVSQSKMVEAPPAEMEELEKIAAKTSPEELQNLFAMLLRSEEEIKKSAVPWIAVEMLTIRMSQAPALVDLSQLIKKIETSSQSSPTGGSGDLTIGTLKAHSTQTERQKTSPVKNSGRSVPPAPVAKAKDQEIVSTPPATAERFKITQIQPALSGPPDEIWSQLKVLAHKHCDTMVTSVMDHGSLITYGPTLVEIGFHKDFYRSVFQERLNEDPSLKNLLSEFFNGASIKILTLAQETPLKLDTPYSEPQDSMNDKTRALRNEALSNTVIQDILREFDGSSIEDIKIVD